MSAKPKPSPGSDGITIDILKHIDKIVTPITTPSNKILESGIFPKALKLT